MAKNMYIGVDNVARKVKQPFIGVDNVARKVKSGFIGVDNVARQFYESTVYHTWKKYSLIGASFTLSQTSFGSTTSSNSNTLSSTKISIDSSLSDPALFIFTAAKYAYASPTYTIQSAQLKQGSLASAVNTSYVRYSDKVCHSDKVVTLSPISQFVDLNPNNSRRDTYLYVFPGWVPVDDCLCYRRSGGYYTYLARRLVPNSDSMTLVLYNYSEDNDGDASDSISYCALSSASVSQVTAPAGTYPDNGLHTDGCIYIRQ